MNDEALELRREIQNWQTRKFTIFAATTSFVTALSAYLATSADKVSWLDAEHLTVLAAIVWNVSARQLSQTAMPRTLQRG